MNCVQVFSLELFFKHLLAPFPQNFNIYKRMFFELMNLQDRDGANAYRMWANLREVLHLLVSYSICQRNGTYFILWWLCIALYYSVTEPHLCIEDLKHKMPSFLNALSYFGLMFHCFNLIFYFAFLNHYFD